MWTMFQSFPKDSLTTVKNRLGNRKSNIKNIKNGKKKIMKKKKKRSDKVTSQMTEEGGNFPVKCKLFQGCNF